MSSKEQFLKTLEENLSRLPSEERRDIVRDQDEYLREAIRSGRSEAEAVASLGDPTKLARELVAEARLTAIEESIQTTPKTPPTALTHQLGATTRAVFAIAALAPFNLIFVLGPFMACVGILFAGWAVSGAFAFTGGAVLFAVVSELLTVGASIWAHVSSISLGLGVIAVAVSCLGLMAGVTSLFTVASLRYLRWNLELISDRA